VRLSGYEPVLPGVADVGDTREMPAHGRFWVLLISRASAPIAPPRAMDARWNDRDHAASATFDFSHPSNFSVSHPVSQRPTPCQGLKRRLQLGRPFASLGGLSQCFVSFRGQTGSGRRSGSRLPDRASPDLFCCGTDLESAFFVRALGQSWSFRQCLGSVFLDCDRIGPTCGPYRPPT
jgi:hypothetical protein